MRQAGLKPKSHSSGTYWIRTNANRAINGDKVSSSEHKKTWVNHVIEGTIAFVIVAYVFVTALN